MKNIIFVRHGESIANAEGWIAGRFDAEITQKGREQAFAASEKIIADEKEVNIILVSPLSRAQETAKIIAREIGYPLDGIKIEPDLIEIETGKWTHGIRQQMFDDMESGVFPVKYFEEIADSSRRLIEKISRMPEENIMLVGHGGTGRMMMQIIQDPENWRDESKLPRIKNCDPTYIMI